MTAEQRWVLNVACPSKSGQVAAISEKLVDRLKQEFGRLSKIEGKETGDWVLAAGAYHSGTVEHAERYSSRFEQILADLGVRVRTRQSDHERRGAAAARRLAFRLSLGIARICVPCARRLIAGHIPYAPRC